MSWRSPCDGADDRGVLGPDAPRREQRLDEHGGLLHGVRGDEHLGHVDALVAGELAADLGHGHGHGVEDDLGREALVDGGWVSFTAPARSPASTAAVRAARSAMGGAPLWKSDGRV